jgi:hypothetical protein
VGENQKVLQMEDWMGPTTKEQMKAREMVPGNPWENSRGCWTVPTKWKENRILIHLVPYLGMRIRLEL